MGCFLLIIELFCGLIILFAVGGLIGHIFRLDEYLNNDPVSHSKEDT